MVGAWLVVRTRGAGRRDAIHPNREGQRNEHRGKRRGAARRGGPLVSREQEKNCRQCA